MLYQTQPTWPAAAVGDNLVEFVVISFHPPGFVLFLRNQTGEPNEDMMGTILSASFRSLRVALICVISLGLSIDLDLLSGLGAILGLWKLMPVWTLCPTVFWIAPVLMCG